MKRNTVGVPTKMNRWMALPAGIPLGRAESGTGNAYRAFKPRDTCASSASGVSSNARNDGN